MKILLISDSHFKSIFKLDIDEFDYVIHTGDINPNDLDYFKLEPEKYYYVKGNCDITVKNYPLELEFTINDKKFFICHSNTYNTKESFDRLYNKGIDVNPNYVIFGHTHNRHCEKVNGVYFINPGSFLEGSYAVIEDDYLQFYEYAGVFKKKFVKGKKIHLV